MAEEDNTMDLIAERVEVWAANIEDKPGSLATILAGLREAGTDLNFILALVARACGHSFFFIRLRATRNYEGRRSWP